PGGHRRTPQPGSPQYSNRNGGFAFPAHRATEAARRRQGGPCQMLRRSTIFALLSSASALAAPALASVPAHAEAVREVGFDIPASDLASALNEAGRQSGVRIAFPYDRAAGFRAAALRGRMTAAE